MRRRFLPMNGRRSILLIVLMLLAVSLTTLGFYRQRLGAVAAAPLLPDAPLPTLTMTAAPKLAETEANRSVAVMIRGGMKTYDTLDATLTEDRHGQVTFKLTILPNGRGADVSPSPRHYEAEVESAEFEAFWTSLHRLDIDQLPSAYAGGHPGDGAALGQPRMRVIDGVTYEFTVQTQAPAFKHQFQVYAPSAVVDRRYQEITTEFYNFLKTVFGDRPFTELVQSGQIGNF